MLTYFQLRLDEQATKRNCYVDLLLLLSQMNLEVNARVRAGRYPGYYPCSHLVTITEVLAANTRRGTTKYRILFDKPLPYETKPRREEVVSGMHRGHQLVYVVEVPPAAAAAAETETQTKQ